MKHEEFRIGMEFWCAGRRWRCTDVGTRVVVAICLEPHEIATVTYDAAGDRKVVRTTTDDESWFNGPPYAVAEHVFDEYSFEGCTLSPDVDEACTD